MKSITLPKEQQKNIYELISDAVIIVDLDNCIRGWNAAAKKLYGWSSREVLYQPLDMLLHTEYVNTTSGEVLQSVLETGSWQVEVTQMHHTHIPLLVLSSLSLKRYEFGSPEGLVWINKDISHIKEFEESIVSYAKSTDIIHKVLLAGNKAEDLTDLYRQIIQQLLRLLDFDAGGVFLLHENTQKVKLEYAYNLPESMWTHYHGMSIYDFPMSQVFLQGKPFITENYDLMVPHQHKLSGFLSMASVPVFLGDQILGSLCVASQRRHILSSDEKKIINIVGQQMGVVISRLQTQNELHLLNQQLGESVSKHSDALKESNHHLQEFTSVVAHDLREPIRMILSYLDLAQLDDQTSLSDQSKEYVKIARSGAMRMMEMLEGIRSYSKIKTQPQALKLTDLNQVVKDVFQILCMPIKETKAKITVGELPVVPADSLQMIQLFQNLIHNSINYRKEEELRILIDAKEFDSHWVISVKDNGRGINPNVAPHIFQMFRRGTSRQGDKGLGIGLAICKGILGRHNGEIWMESESGIGTTFFFSLPKKAS